MIKIENLSNNLFKYMIKILIRQSVLRKHFHYAGEGKAYTIS